MKLKCSYCNKPFEPYHSKQRFCSMKCKNSFRRLQKRWYFNHKIKSVSKLLQEYKREHGDRISLAEFQKLLGFKSLDRALMFAVKMKLKIKLAGEEI